MPRAVERAVTAAVEYGIARAGLTVVRALDRDVVGQAHRPRGAAGRVTAWQMAHRPSNRRRSTWVVSLLDVRPADHVLEIGFGPGVAVAELVRAGAGHVYGIDHSDVMLRHASRRNAAAIRAGRVTLVRASVDRIPPALDGPFDAIVAINSLAFWPAPAERLAELRRRLAPGGRVGIASQPRCPGATADTSRSAAREIEDLLREAGFTSLSIHTLPLNPQWPASSPPARARPTGGDDTAARGRRAPIPPRAGRQNHAHPRERVAVYSLVPARMHRRPITCRYECRRETPRTHPDRDRARLVGVPRVTSPRAAHRIVRYGKDHGFP